jgi:lipopolysaccharide export system protein LptA
MLSVAAAIAVVLGIAVTQGAAQSERKSPSLFKSNPNVREQPVKITSAALEVRDKDKKATFTGDVHVVQGETDLRCNTLVVHYDGEASKVGGKSSSSKGGGQIRRMEAIGSVVVTQDGQRAVGDRADYDMQTNTLVLIGNVIVTRGEDVLRGQRLFVDMTTGVSRMESGGGRVEGMFKSSSGKSPPPPQPAARPGRPN